MKNNKMKKILIIVPIVLVLFSVGALFAVSFTIANSLVETDGTKIIRNVLPEHNKYVSRFKLMKSDYNDAITAFGGVERTVYNKSTHRMISKDDDKIEEYVKYYKMDKDNKKFDSEEELKDYIYNKSRYYHEEMLEIYLLFYNKYTKNELTVENIKNYVNEGNTDFQDEIWEYIKWFKSGSYMRGFAEYNLKYMEANKDTDPLNPENAGDIKNFKKFKNHKNFDDLTLKEKIEFIKNAE